MNKKKKVPREDTLLEDVCDTLVSNTLMLADLFHELTSRSKKDK